MPVNGVSNSGKSVEQVQSERRLEDVKSEKERRDRVDSQTRETHRTAEPGRGENIDVTG